MPIIDLNTLAVGDTISFSSINPNDNVLWQGTIIGICGWAVVEHMQSDLLPYYRAVKKVLPEMDILDNLKFFVIRYSQGEKSGKLVMAQDWIEPSSVQKIDINQIFDIRIYDLPKDQIQTILDLLKSNSIKCAAV